MPICFKCGKELATDQSLQYHLQKKVKCNTLKCLTCKMQFPNKLLLENHKHECSSITQPKSITRHSIFDQINSKYLYIIEINKEYNITYASNNFKNKSELIDKNIENIIQIESILKKSLQQPDRVQMYNKTCNLEIKYRDDYILLMNTLVLT